MGRANPPLCKDCKWFIADNKCTAPQNEEWEGPKMLLVSGSKEGHYTWKWLTCSHQRLHSWYACRFIHTSCGKEGRWFEPAKNRPSPVTPLRAA